MRNFTKVLFEAGKYEFFRLLDNDGHFVQPMEAFTSYLLRREAAPATVKRYQEAVGQFLDYLCEVGVFDRPCSPKQILEAVEAYLPARAGRTLGESKDVYSKAVETLGLKRLGNSSLQNTNAAINAFLRLSDYQAALAADIADWNDDPNSKSQEKLILFSGGSTQKRSGVEAKRLMQKSMLASVVRMNRGGLEKTRSRLASSARQDPFEDKDFPVEHVMPLLDAANSWRDRAFWALTAGAGLRCHEAAQVTWPAVLVDQRKVFVFDPKALRYADRMPEEYFPRFKGRLYSETYMIPQLRDVFFEALEQYMRQEYRPTGEHNLVFQDISRGSNGRPYSTVSDKSKVQSFKRACCRAGVPLMPNGRSYTPHSLRHFYGVFMLNYIPVSGGFGLKLNEVQRLMGHETIASTRQYAREDKLILQSKLELFDQMVMQGGVEYEDVRMVLAKRYHEAAQRLAGNPRPAINCD